MSIKDNKVSDVVELKKSKIIPSFGPVEQLKVLETKENGKFYTTDTYLLLNQQRLENLLGAEGYANYLASLRSNVMSSHKDNVPMSDDDMMSTLKSRYCQSPTEIKAWTGELASRFDAAKEAYDNKIKAYLEKQEQSHTGGTVSTPAQSGPSAGNS